MWTIDSSRVERLQVGYPTQLRCESVFVCVCVFSVVLRVDQEPGVAALTETTLTPLVATETRRTARTSAPASGHTWHTHRQ